MMLELESLFQALMRLASGAIRHLLRPVVDAPDDDGAVRIAVDEQNEHLVADAGDV